MPSLSVVMIVKNEAHCLAECLDSIRDVADEIVIADTGSTDDTPAVAKRYAAKVHEVPWTDDFAAARNECLRHATGDWLLHLDADEVVDPTGAKRIRELADVDGDGADAVEVILANYSDDFLAWRWAPVEPGNDMARGHAGYIAIGLLRLFRNHRGFEYREAVHENITESVAERGGVIRAEPIVIHHYGFAGGPEKSASKASLYCRIAREKVKQRPGDVKAWYDLAEQAFACGDPETAEDAARNALAIDANNLSAASMLANILLNRGDLGEARALFERIEESGLTAHHIGTVLGAIACRQGRLDDARHHLEEVLRRFPKAVQAYLQLARVLDLQNDTRSARAQLEHAQETAPRLRETHNRAKAHELRQLGERQLKYGTPQEALRTLVQSLQLDSEDPLTHNAIGRTLIALGLQEKAQESFDRAKKLAPSLQERSVAAEEC